MKLMFVLKNIRDPCTRRAVQLARLRTKASGQSHLRLCVHSSSNAWTRSQQVARWTRLNGLIGGQSGITAAGDLPVAYAAGLITQETDTLTKYDPLPRRPHVCAPATAAIRS